MVLGALDVNYADAKSSCESAGMSMVKITSEAMNSVVRDLCVFMICWIGIEKASGKWLYHDGSVVEYTNWDVLGVNEGAGAGGELYGVMGNVWNGNSGGWHDCNAACHSLGAAVCQRAGVRVVGPP